MAENKSGVPDKNDNVTAYCRQCGKKLQYHGQAKIEGGNTGVFSCTNRNCSQYTKKKYNTQVDFKK